MATSRARAWVFTWNNPPGQPDPDLLANCTYFVYQGEVGESGTYHFQGYLEVKNPVRLATITAFMPGCHAEPRRGTAAQARTYATKEDTRADGPYEWGTISSQGARSDLHAAAALLTDGTSLKRVAEEYPAQFIRYSAGFTRFKALVTPPRGDDEGTACFVFFGAGGTGKTSFALRLARYLSPGLGVFRVPEEKGSGLYWDGYEPGQCVIIDEFKGSRMRPTFFNQLVDKGPMSVPVHGGTVVFNSPLIIITTNVHPKDWWPNVEFQRSLRRRITLWPIFRRLDRAPRARSQLCVPGLSPLLRDELGSKRFLGQLN